MSVQLESVILIKNLSAINYLFSVNTVLEYAKTEALYNSVLPGAV